MEHIYERDLVALTARGFWAIAMSRPQPERAQGLPAAEQLAAAYAKRKRKQEKQVDIWKKHPGSAGQNGSAGVLGALQATTRYEASTFAYIYALFAPAVEDSMRGL